MTPIYWIEDELGLLSWIEKELRKQGYKLVHAKDAAEMVKLVPEVSLHPGPILLDLYLPDGETNEIPRDVVGPEVGIWLLKRLQITLGKDWKIAIISGNLSFDIGERLGKEFGIGGDAIFAKPLVEEGEMKRLLDWVDEAAKRMT